jgi:hypothetical protein
MPREESTMSKHGLESAGGPPRVQPQLRKVQFVDRPKKRHLLRNAAFVGSTILALLQRLGIVERPRKRHLLRNVVVAGTIAASAFVAGAVWWRRDRRSGAEADDRGDAEASSPEPQTPDAEVERDAAATDAEIPQDVATPVSA